MKSQSQMNIKLELLQKKKGIESPFLFVFQRGDFARKIAEFTIIPPPAHFVKRKSKKSCTMFYPKFSTTFRD